MASVSPVPLAGSHDFRPSSAPAEALLTADAGSIAALGIRHDGVPGVRVAPAQVGVQSPGLDGVVAVVGVGDGELPQWAEVGQDDVDGGAVRAGRADGRQRGEGVSWRPSCSTV